MTRTWMSHTGSAWINSFWVFSTLKDSDNTFYFDRPLQHDRYALSWFDIDEENGDVISRLEWYHLVQMSLVHATILIWWTTGKVLININVSMAVRCGESLGNDSQSQSTPKSRRSRMGGAELGKSGLFMAQ
ncbi:hypothetical protein K503DRAFT_783112 [Rhizopogon vinicolor AM-OR11-026]|uniref:Uncharacterized protein n=1 Tax=Rhizopogon vinicolor AM-OR11-026 TaxID=1314800 RepID=A0A1B7MZT8_9AGAM|nr:hypothetical protein K503DRAFT_783112 [Rhizopogon vinicolor AM-OR11-026]